MSPFAKVSIKDICVIYECSVSSANTRKKDILFCLGKSKFLNYNDLAKYEGCSVDDLFNILRK